MEQSKEPQPVPGYVNKLIKDTMFMNGNNTDAEKSIFLKASEFGYSLAASEISTLQKTIEEQKKEIERLKLIISFAHQSGWSGAQTGNYTIMKSWEDFKRKHNL